MGLKTATKKKNSITVNGALLFGMGMFSTMPIVCLKLAGRYISLFTIFFALTFLFLLVNSIVRGIRNRIDKNIQLILLWFVMVSVSSLIGWVYFRYEPEWRHASVSYLPKLVLYIVFALLWGAQKKRKTYIKYALKGLLVGCILNMVWTVIDAAGYYTLGVSVNNLVFKRYAVDTGVHFGTVSLIINGMIRASGFNSDPAHIGFIAPAMAAYAVYKKNGWIFLLSMASILGSASTTALVCTLFVLIFEIKHILPMLTAKNVVRIGFCMTIAIIIVFIVPRTRLMLIAVVQKFFGRISSVYGSGGGGERLIYLLQFPKALIGVGIMCLFGTGFGTASYAYTFNADILPMLGVAYRFPYDPEMTYISYVFDLGIFGFAVYMFILYRLMHGLRRDSSEEGLILRGLIIGMVLSAAFYHYTLMAMQVLVMILGMAFLDIDREKGFCLRSKKLLKRNALEISC